MAQNPRFTCGTKVNHVVDYTSMQSVHTLCGAWMTNRPLDVTKPPCSSCEKVVKQLERQLRSLPLRTSDINFMHPQEH